MKFLIITLLICILAVSGKPEPESAKPEPETDSKAAEPEAESEPEPEGEAETCIGDHCVQDKSEEKHGKAEPKSGFKFADNLLSSFSN